MSVQRTGLEIYHYPVSEVTDFLQIKHSHNTGREYNADRFFENLAGLSQHYGEIGSINILQQFLTAIESGIEYCIFPTPIRLFVRYAVIPLAKLVGYQAFYPEYHSLVA